VTTVNTQDFTIRNVHFSSKVLQPVGGSRDAGVPVVLGNPEATHGPFQTPNPWHVTSPLIGDGGVVIHP
jgi:hypothetical protein